MKKLTQRLMLHACSYKRRSHAKIEEYSRRNSENKVDPCHLILQIDDAHRG